LTVKANFPVRTTILGRCLAIYARWKRPLGLEHLSEVNERNDRPLIPYIYFSEYLLIFTNQNFNNAHLFFISYIRVTASSCDNIL